MPRVRPAAQTDLAYLLQHEGIPATELAAIVQRRRILIAEDSTHGVVVGWLRWGLFWDQVPFMNMLHVAEDHRRSGIGTDLVRHWESQCRADRHGMVLASTQSDESAQHLYRRLGYIDAGSLLLPGEPLEIVFVKSLD